MKLKLKLTRKEYDAALQVAATSAREWPEKADEACDETYRCSVTGVD